MNRALKHFRLARAAAIKDAKFTPPICARPLGIILAAGFVLASACLANAANRLPLVGIVAITFRACPNQTGAHVAVQS